MRFGVALIVIACAAAALPARAQEPLKHRGGAVIGPDDTVTISAVEADEISKPWKVGSAGELNLPMVGRIQVAGMTIEQFEAALTQRLRKYYLHPQVTAVLTEMRSQPVTVTGPVEKPGNYQLQGEKTLFDVLVMAGGPKDAAGTEVTITRLRERGHIDYPGARQDESGKYDILPMNLKEAMDGRSDPARIPIAPYDVVTVSEYKPQRVVHIAGEVNKPGIVELVTLDTVSLMKVLAAAGGLTRTASAGKTLIVHLNEKGVQTSSAYVNLKKIMKGEARDLDLTPGDIVIVPSNTLMSYVQAASLSAVTTGVYVLGRF